MGGRGSQGSGFLVLYVCVCVWCLWWCKCLCVGVYDVAAGAERQNSGRPDSKRVTADREGERERERGSQSREEKVNVTLILSQAKHASHFLNLCFFFVFFSLT